MLRIVNNPEGESIEVQNPTREGDRRKLFVIKPRTDGRIINLSEETDHHD